MKRLAVLTLTAALAWAGGPLRAADAVPLPLPTGLAPTTPQVPVPVLADGVLVPADGSKVSLRERLGLGAGAVHVAGGTCDDGKCGPRAKGKPGVVRCAGTGEGLVHAKPQWCTDCAPAVRYPLPPLPAGVGGSEDVRQAGGTYATGGSCSAGGCATQNCDRSCWDKLKGWLCFRQTPVRTPCVPTNRQPPLYTYFSCRENAACGTGACATANPVGCVAATTGHGLPTRSVAGGCVPCPQPGETVMPGYRLASPEAPAVTQWAPPSGPVWTSSYKVPQK
jgi:hypothetical protein